MCWAVWEPYDADELRFAITATLASEDALEPRRGLRVPIRLPMLGVADSLNVSATAAVLLYEALRQREGRAG